MRINGWQRLWLLASILWAVVILVLARILQYRDDQTVPSANVVLFVVRLWIVPVAAVHGLGLGLRSGRPRISVVELLDSRGLAGAQRGSELGAATRPGKPGQGVVPAHRRAAIGIGCRQPNLTPISLLGLSPMTRSCAA